MWGLMSLIQFGPLHATQELLTEIYPFLSNGTLGREFLTDNYPFLSNGILRWVFVVGFVVVALCASYLIWNGPPISKVTIQQHDDLFPIMVASLRKLRQPRSVLIATDTTANGFPDLDSDSDSDSDSKRSDSVDKLAMVKNEPNFGTNLYWYGWRPMWVQRGFLEGSRGRNGPPQEFLSFTIWSQSPKAMMEIVSGCFQEQRGNEVAYTIIRESDSQSFSPWGIKTAKPSRPLQSIILPEEIKDDIVQDLENFKQLTTHRWYTTRGIPYHRGHLYYGEPGTGKSSLAVALAGYLNLGLYVVPINNPKIDQDALTQMFRCLHTPCMVLLEDIDALNGTTTERGSSETSQSGLTNLSTLLNILDGVAAKEGIILIMTTNHLDALDEALIRPGRIDKKVHFKNATQSGLKDLFLITYLSHASEEKEIHKLAERFSTILPSNVFTVAEVQGYLLPLREDPYGAIAGAAVWSELKVKKGLSPAAKGKDQEDVPENGFDDKGVSSTGDITG